LRQNFAENPKNGTFGALVVTLVMLMRLINCHFIIIIIIIRPSRSADDGELADRWGGRWVRVYHLVRQTLTW